MKIKFRLILMFCVAMLFALSACQSSANFEKNDDNFSINVQITPSSGKVQFLGEITYQGENSLTVYHGDPMYRIVLYNSDGEFVSGTGGTDVLISTNFSSGEKISFSETLSQTEMVSGLDGDSLVDNPLESGTYTFEVILSYYLDSNTQSQSFEVILKDDFIVA